MAPETLLHVVWPALLLGVVLALGLERLLAPAMVLPWRRPPATLALHAGLWLTFQGGLLLLLGRPWLALVIALIGLLAVIVVSNAKYASLREPFTVHDFEYFTDALRHPRLYLPFLRVNFPTVLAAAAVLSGLALCVRLEPWLVARYAPLSLCYGAGGLFLLAGGLVWLGRRAPRAHRYIAAEDLAHLGLLSYLWHYACAARQPTVVAAPLAGLTGSTLAPAALPHLLVVQSESFFDVRELAGGIRPELLAEFDAACADALSYGRLQVPAWGANTVRTEFAFLWGLSAAAQGVHQFQPYQRLAWQGLPQLVSTLKNAGYRTVCLHPYWGSFYAREELFPQLGFDSFIDIRAFSDQDRAGPYVGDLALAEKIAPLLAQDHPQPLFIFAITMENHGPLHLERVQPDELPALYTSPPPAACAELSVYLRHLRNADRMLGELRRQLAAATRPGCLCWYGDHVPIMPEVYAELGSPEGRTDYCLWRTDGAHPRGVQHHLAVEDLALRLCEIAGLVHAP